MRPGFLRATMAVLAGTLLSATPLFAGNIVLNGHDDHIHGFFGSAPASAELAEMIAFARQRSPRWDRPNQRLPVLLGLASSIACGGCDRTDEDSARDDAKSVAIASFFNDDGGILAPPEDDHERRRWHRGRDHDDDYPRTACGPALGIRAVDGERHHFFLERGTGGVDPAYCMVERQGDPNTGAPGTIDGRRAAILTGGPVTPTAVPEPASLTLLGLGLAGVVGRRLRRVSNRFQADPTIGV